jgi:hypothetical protein
MTAETFTSMRAAIAGGTHVLAVGFEAADPTG